MCPQVICGVVVTLELYRLLIPQTIDGRGSNRGFLAFDRRVLAQLAGVGGVGGGGDAGGDGGGAGG